VLPLFNFISPLSRRGESQKPEAHMPNPDLPKPAARSPQPSPQLSPNCRAKRPYPTPCPPACGVLVAPGLLKVKADLRCALCFARYSAGRHAT
jgi:hypothetical protein